MIMTNQTVKNGLRTKKIKLPQMNSFSRKTTNKIFMYLLAPFILQNFKKLQSYQDVPFSGPKWPICPEQKIFGTSHYYYFYLLTGPFQCAKFVDPELWGCAIFGSKMVHLPQTNCFFGKLLISFSSTYQPLSLCKILKNSSTDPEFWGCTIFGLKMANFSKSEFFQKTC